LPDSIDFKRECVEPDHPWLSVRRQCELLDLNRSSWYYEARGESAENITLMRRIDEQYLVTPFYGSRPGTDQRFVGGPTRRQAQARATVDADHGLVGDLPQAAIVAT